MADDFKSYTVDTNVIRYYASKTGEPDLRLAAKVFWRKIKTEIAEGSTIIFVPAEVKRELEIQSYTLSGNENMRVQKLLDVCQETSPPVSDELEHSIRKMTAYLRANFKDILTDGKMAYGGVSDSRILYSSYAADSILVTANVRDFLLYPLLFPYEEQRLYNLIINDFIQFSEETHRAIWSDTKFKTLFREFVEAEQDAEFADE
ncbi:PIN domain-containing protein [Planococcus lenghuensis]|uniref:PIN domain-containing protein n=1 Tax=Planococcus lenghuensis TaxID=2213202 RepID=A0A1Q2KVR4_9BACL|nr:DUF4411 family protein [Planococcus lenghuensis]AQQ52233.1 hypothetical protein B0X71_03315 [Planococcus lenghuensis]